jgi:pimeloyl-ACP methyl ester carboxylesterase
MAVGRSILRGFLIFVAVIVALGAAMLLYRAWRQHENELAFAIPNGIQESSFVRIGGIDQWIQIRGQDRANPVLLIVHGGPGISMAPLTPVFRSWEKYFTVVQWDQRGAGKTYGRNGEAGEGAMTIDRMTRDGLEVTQYLRAHLRKDKIIVVGHSWGTILALEMVKQRPDLFYAYVGTGQLVNKQQNEKTGYAQLMDKVRAAHDDKAVAALGKIGPPPYDDIDKLYAERKWQAAYDTPAEQDLSWNMIPTVLFAPDYSLTDIHDFLQSAQFSQRETYAEENGYDARKLGLKFEVPFFIFEGDRDSMTPSILAQRYFADIQASKKEFVVLKGGGHAAMLTMPDAFLRELVARVRPIALQSQSGVTHG